MHYWLGLYRNTLIKKKTKIKWCRFLYLKQVTSAMTIYLLHKTS